MTVVVWSNLALAFVVAVSNVMTYYIRCHDRNEHALDMFIERLQTLLLTKIRNMEIRTIVKSNDFRFDDETKHLKVGAESSKATGFHHEVLTLLLAYEELAYYVKNGRIKFKDAKHFFGYDIMLFWDSKEIQKMIAFKRTKDSSFLQSFATLCHKIKEQHV
jgi:hypothetical protein